MTKAYLGYSDWLIQLKSILKLLSQKQALLFAACCCERHMESYQAFFKEEHWGDPQSLMKALEILWSKPMRESGENDVSRLIAACDAAAPDTEHFGSPFTSGALNAANSIAESLEFVIDQDIEHVVEVASFTRDTIDHHIQMNSSGYASPAEVDQHPLMIAELQKQKASLDALTALQSVNLSFVARFRASCCSVEL